MGAAGDTGAVAGTARAEVGSGVRLRRTLRAGDRAASGMCVLALVLMVALLLGIAAGYRPLVDHSDSMAPAIRTGDLLITLSKPALSVRRGEIVSFKDSALAGKLVTHRVVAIHSAGSQLHFITKGDANSATESWSTDRGASIRVLVFRVPEIGRTMAWLADPVVRTAILALAALLLTIAALRWIWRA